jgi:hypothetical protein
MFLIRLPHSMREVVGAGTHKTAAAMVKAADAPWDAQGGHDPTVAATSTQRSRSPAPNSEREATNEAVTPTPKVAHLPTLTFIIFKTLAVACVYFTITTPIRLTGMLYPVLSLKTSLPPNHLRFGGQPNTYHCHDHALPCQRWIFIFIFS